MSDPGTDSTALAISWDDVLAPGKASSDAQRIDPFGELPVPVPTGAVFSLANACFLAAQSLLIYRAYSDRPNSDDVPPFPGRRVILHRLGFEETFGGELAGTTCSILEPIDAEPDAVPAAVVFRGTSHLNNWLTNLQSYSTSWPGGGHVHRGFATAYEEIWDELGPRLEGIARSGRHLLITGHSLGGALATLTLSRLFARYGDSVASAYTFGSPRVGNSEFAGSMTGAPLFRLVNNEDVVTRLPLPFVLSRRLSYLHAGDAYYIDGSGVLHARGRGDLAEETASLTQIKKLARRAKDSFKLVRPPSFLADHAPARYLEKVRHAHAVAGGDKPGAPLDDNR